MVLNDRRVPRGLQQSARSWFSTFSQSTSLGLSLQGGFLKFERKCAEIWGVHINVNYLRSLEFSLDCDTCILADLLLQTNDDEDMIENKMALHLTVRFPFFMGLAYSEVDVHFGLFLEHVGGISAASQIPNGQQDSTTSQGIWGMR